MNKYTPITGKLNNEYFRKLNEFITNNPGQNKNSVVGKAVSAFLDGKLNQSDSDLQKQLIEEIEFSKKVQSELKSYTEINTAQENLIAELTEKVKLLENENQRLETFKLDETKVKEWEETIKTLQTENQNLKNQPKQTANIREDQEIITIPKTLKPFIGEIVLAETQRVGKPVAIGDMLLNLFWYQIRYGAGDHLPRSYSNSQLKKVIEQMKNSDNGE